MRNFLVIVVCGVCVLQVISAASSIIDIKGKQAIVEEFMREEITKLQSRIAKSIFLERDNINSRVTVIKAEIMKSPQQCHIWIKRIDSTANKALAELQKCDLSDRIIKLREKYASEFKRFDKEVVRVDKICKSNPSNCQAEIDKLDRTLDLYKANIISDIMSIGQESQRCVESRSIAGVKAIQITYSNFLRCKVQM